MNDLTHPDYDSARKWITIARSHKREWSDIYYACKKNDEELQMFLESQEMNSFWVKMTCEEWKQIVTSQKNAEENTQRLEVLQGHAMIMDEGQDNNVNVPTDPHSSWQLYRKKLLDNGIKEDNVNTIERVTLKILRRLSSDTTNMKPVKGLVIGNVQSGKTANMAALMAMAADWGWNMFIVLSGTIENLRQQTQRRLLSDLNQPGNISWIGLEHLQKKALLGQRLQDLHIENDRHERYFNVCLKNSARLKKMIQWLQSDVNKQKKLKILVIDDEADQAGINTADVSKDERRKINALICNLVNGNNEKGEHISSKYQAMNYIGYTATPYANILNECSDESLYPKNFITTLKVSNEYFGPQQIFGIDGNVNMVQSTEGEEPFVYPGLDIVREVCDDDLDEVKLIHDGEGYCIPESLENALLWFMCSVACMRYQGYKKPISMLVHTSQKTDHHENVSEAIKQWIRSHDTEWIINRCSILWVEEKSRFTLKKFREQYANYGIPDSEINDYPEFSEIQDNIYELLETEISNIKLADDDELTYHSGIHLCVDNCKNNDVKDDMYVRLAYPEPDKMPVPAPAFIVVGGATLSRGLTIEGLISTFFLRSVGQADTLMQMGRWFGYRRKYELLPRLWVTDKTRKQFEFLSSLDQELRDEIFEMDLMGKSPEFYGPKVKNTPKLSFIRITAKNRMQCAKITDVDYSGSFNQTYIFENRIDVLESNLKLVTDFINGLGKPEAHKEINKHAAANMIWRNIGFDTVKKLLSQYKYHPRLSVFNNMNAVIKWLDKITSEGKLNNWNVICCGSTKSTNIYKTDAGSVGKVKRTRKGLISYPEEEGDIINIGVLSAPKDLISDIDLDGQPSDIADRINKFEAKDSKKLRMDAGLSETPQLLIYIVDKNSESNSDSRKPLNAVCDIAGLCINIPGSKRGSNYAATISIHIDKNDIFDGETDLEGNDEN